MIYNANNAAGARVYDVDAMQEVKQVLSIDTDKGIVYRCHTPLRINASGDGVEVYAEQYRAIYPIIGLEPRPCLFHCYGIQE